MELEKLYANNIHDKGLISTIYTEIIQYNSKISPNN